MKLMFYTLLILLLTILTQVGGVLLLIMLPFLHMIRLASKWQQVLLRGGIFLLIYTSAVFLLIPPLASLNNRVPLPCFTDEKTPLAAANIGYCLLLRNYVTPQVSHRLQNIARTLQQQYTHDSTLYYLDASFPFWDGFPLLPHLSHKDGLKVDLAYHYRHKTTEQPLDSPPAWLGYWFYEQPESPENAACQGKRSWLRWDFDALQSLYADYEMDEQRTRTLLKLLTPEAQKILLEPHLKKRLRLDSSTIRFQGCHAARHDDHIHVQW